MMHRTPNPSTQETFRSNLAATADAPRGIAAAQFTSPVTAPTARDTALADSYACCVDITRRSRSSFYFSFYTLPKPLFRDMCVLYAFMRVSDDLGDNERIPARERAERLAAWREKLHLTLEEGRFEHPVLPALADIVARHAIPWEYFFDVIDGIAMDLDPKGFETFADLSEYCYHVAGVVGLCCINIWGFSDRHAIPLAIDCGLAFQLTNILRDVADDARSGRCYLPQDDLRRFGLTPDDLHAGSSNPRFRELMAFEVARAREYFARARRLMDHIESPGKPILAAMHRTYSSLLDAIERRGYDVQSGRIRIGRWRRIRIVLWSLIRYRWLAARGSSEKSVAGEQTCPAET